MPRQLSLVERETCNLVVAGSIPVRGFSNSFLKINLNFTHISFKKETFIYYYIDIIKSMIFISFFNVGTVGQLGRSFGLWEPETPVQIRAVPSKSRLSSIWQSVGLQIQMLLVQVRQAGFTFKYVKICFLNVRL